MSVVVSPDHTTVLDQEGARHQPRISLGLPLGESFTFRRKRTLHQSGAEQLSQLSPADAKGVVKNQIGIGNRTGFRPEIIEDGSGVLRSPLMDEQDRGKPGFLGQGPELSDGLAAENSAQVTQKDQQGPPL